MKRHTVFIDEKTQQSEYDSYPQIDAGFMQIL